MFLKNNVHNIFLMLGFNCNFNCRYCLQAPNVEKTSLPTQINEDIYEFVKNIAKNQFPQKLNIQFYGGEPFCYFDKIQEIHNNLKNEKNITFSFISNGSLITEDMVNWLNDNKIFGAISWDGTSTKQTRRVDVFSSKQKNTLFKLDHLGISAVLSSYTSPKQLINDFQALSNEYYEKHQYHLNFNIDEIFDTGLADRTLLDCDYEKIKNESRELIKEYLKIKTNKSEITEECYQKTKYALFAYYDRFYWAIKQYLDNPDYTIMPWCGNGFEVLNLDLEGNLYSCHNCTDKLGTIYSRMSNYVENFIRTSSLESRINNKCKKCSVYPVCRGGCKLVKDRALDESYCKLKTANFGPILEEFIKLGRRNTQCQMDK